MKSLLLVMSAVCGGLVLGNGMMVQRLVKDQVLGKVNATVVGRVTAAIGRALPLASGKGRVAALTQFALRARVGDADLSKLTPAQRQLPDHMRDEQGLLYDVLEYPLHVAVAVGDYGEVAWLLAENKAGVDDLDRRGRAPIHLAVEAGDLNMVALLIRNGADVSIAVSERQWFYEIVDNQRAHNPLADYYNIEPIVRADGSVRQNKVKDSVTNRDGYLTPAHLAVRAGHLDILALLLLEDAAIAPMASSHYSTATVRSPVRIAAKNGDLDSVVLLDAAGADLAEVEFDYFTNPFRLAVANNRRDVVEYLLDRMPEELIRSAMNSVKDTVIADILLPRIADVPLETIEGRLKGDRLLHSHASAGNVEVLKQLIDKYGMDVNARTDDGQTALHKALNSGKRDKIAATVIALLQRGADPLAASNWSTPFEYAREKGLGHLFLPYLKQRDVTIPPEVNQYVAREAALAQHAQ